MSRFFLNLAHFVCCFFTLIGSSQALVLENLDEQVLYSLFEGKRIGYYIGSFDPLHKGHESVVALTLLSGLCDYVLICPYYEGDSFDKRRTKVSIRQEMIFKTFEWHPNVIVTKLSPIKIQKLLTRPDRSDDLILDDTNIYEKEPKRVSPAFPGTCFISIVGYDVALKLKSLPQLEYRDGFQIPSKYEYHSIGNIIALPISGFIVFQRPGVIMRPLGGEIAGRSILSIIDSEQIHSISSTRIKMTCEDNEDIQFFVNPDVLNIILSRKLYQGNNNKIL
jgi:nicotinic acid mononucleotide adenylyltransferase